MRHAKINDPKMRSPLTEAMRVNPRSGGKSKKSLVATLSLTSLVDAFSIMLLYLLVQNTGGASTLELQKSEKLPVAMKTEGLDAGTLVRIEGNQYFLGEQPIEQVQLAAVLQKTKADLIATVGENDEKAGSLIIQADRDVDFSMIEPVVRAGSITGFHKFKFAVIQGEETTR